MHVYYTICKVNSCRSLGIRNFLLVLKVLKLKKKLHKKIITIIVCFFITYKEPIGHPHQPNNKNDKAYL